MSTSSSLKCQVLVRNLSKRTTTKQLQQYVSRYGSIVDCYLTENDSEGFIEFTDRANVDVFMNKRPHVIDGNSIQCQRCLPSYELQKPVKRLFLRGTVQQLTENRLENYFAKYGKVLSCTIPKGKRNNTFTHFGYAFVAFDDEDVVDKIVQDKPHYIDSAEIEIQKAEDLVRNRRNSNSRSPTPPSSRSPINNSNNNNNNNNNNNKRARRDTPSPISKRSFRSTDELTLRHLEEENRRLREHAIMAKHHFDETVWKLRRDLDDEHRRYDQLKIEYDHLRRDYERLSIEIQQKSSTRYLSSNSKSSRH